MLIGQDFQGYFAKETISIDLVSTQKPEEPIVHYSVMSELAVTIKNWLIKSKFLSLFLLIIQPSLFGDTRGFINTNFLYTTLQPNPTDSTLQPTTLQHTSLSSNIPYLPHPSLKPLEAGIELAREAISPFQLVQPQELTSRRKADKKIVTKTKKKSLLLSRKQGIEEHTSFNSILYRSPWSTSP